MKNLIDLQIQSTASDGKHAPRDLVQMAKEEQLQVIAITDHDTVGGVQEGLLAGGELGVRVIPGIEMSVEEHDAHILGYGIDYTHPKLVSELEKFQQGRIDGAKKIVANLQGAGFVVDWEDVLREATGNVVARPHIARAILKRPENKEKLGTITSVHDFIEAYIGNESPLYVKRTHISARDAIALLREAGGVAVWSHPAIHFRDDPEGLEDFLKQLIEWGIRGMEVCNPSHTEDDVEFINGLTIHYELLRTAGSDFHEKGKSARSPDGLHAAEHLGDYETYGFPTDDIIAKLDKAIVGQKSI